MVVREMIATARERIAKFREAEKMVGARGGAERQRERGASSTHIQEAAGTVSAGRHVDESFTYAEKESYVRFAPFMGMRSCTLEPRSEMQGIECFACDAIIDFSSPSTAVFRRAAGDFLVK